MISKDLILSILAMDAYNRSYGTGSDLIFNDRNSETATGDTLGNYEIITDSQKVFENLIDASGELNVAQANGFYAAAYKAENSNEIIISFRGTDDGSDAWNDAQLIVEESGLGNYGNYGNYKLQ